MAIRRGLGKGKGKGYKNIIPKDPRVHSDSRHGRKQPQRIPNDLVMKYKARQIQENANLKKEFEEGIVYSADLIKKEIDKRGFGVYPLSSEKNTDITIEGVGVGIVSEKWDKLSLKDKKEIILKEKAILNELADSINGEFEIIKSNNELLNDSGVVFDKQFLKENPKKVKKIRKKLKRETLFDVFF